MKGIYMDIESKQKLEKLKKESKRKAAQKQLIEDLKNWFQIDISSCIFADYQISDDIRLAVYEKIRLKDIKKEKFYYEPNVANEKLKMVINKFITFENRQILVYPSTHAYFSIRGDHLYIEFPIAVVSSIKECKGIVFKLMHETHNDLIIVEENLNYGLVISEDEYEYVSIEYWGV